MSDLVGIPEDRFPRIVAHIIFNAIIQNFYSNICYNTAGQTMMLEAASLGSVAKHLIEPPHGKTNNMHRRKQRRRSASW